MFLTVLLRKGKTLFYLHTKAHTQTTYTYENLSTPTQKHSFRHAGAHTQTQIIIHVLKNGPKNGAKVLLVPSLQFVYLSYSTS